MDLFEPWFFESFFFFWSDSKEEERRKEKKSETFFVVVFFYNSKKKKKTAYAAAEEATPPAHPPRISIAACVAASSPAPTVAVLKLPAASADFSATVTSSAAEQMHLEPDRNGTNERSRHSGAHACEPAARSCAAVCGSESPTVLPNASISSVSGASSAPPSRDCLACWRAPNAVFKMPLFCGSAPPKVSTDLTAPPTRRSRTFFAAL